MAHFDQACSIADLETVPILEPILYISTTKELVPEQHCYTLLMQGELLTVRQELELGYRDNGPSKVRQGGDSLYHWIESVYLL